MEGAAHDRAMRRSSSAPIASIEHAGREAVFDTTQPDKNNLIFNGLVTGQLRRAAVAAVRLVPAGLGEPHALRASIRSRTSREFDWNEYREVVQGLHAHARQRGRDQWPAAGAAARRDHAQAPPRHGLPRPRQHHHAAGDEVRLARVGEVHRGRVARDGGRRLGGGARTRAREGPGADHERGVHGHQGDAAQASRDGARRLEAGRQDRRAPAARQLQPLHAARRRASRRSWWTSWPRSARASRTTPRSRPPARSRCRSPTMRPTASSRRSRTTTSAT